MSLDTISNSSVTLDCELAIQSRILLLSDLVDIVHLGRHDANAQWLSEGVVTGRDNRDMRNERGRRVMMN